jgi:hypothetical protein
LAWEKQYATEETMSFEERIKRALKRISTDTPPDPSEIILVAEGFGPWCLAEWDGQDLLALQRLDGRCQVFNVTHKREKAFK